MHCLCALGHASSLRALLLGCIVLFAIGETEAIDSIPTVGEAEQLKTSFIQACRSAQPGNPVPPSLWEILQALVMPNGVTYKYCLVLFSRLCLIVLEYRD
eukprot:SAG31_NODE_76_length_27534_cov_13.661868_17_plen_100_part_00